MAAPMELPAKRKSKEKWKKINSEAILSSSVPEPPTLRDFVEVDELEDALRQECDETVIAEETPSARMEHEPWKPQEGEVSLAAGKSLEGNGEAKTNDVTDSGNCSQLEEDSSSNVATPDLTCAESVSRKILAPNTMDEGLSSPSAPALCTSDPSQSGVKVEAQQGQNFDYIELTSIEKRARFVKRGRIEESLTPAAQVVEETTCSPAAVSQEAAAAGVCGDVKGLAESGVADTKVKVGSLYPTLPVEDVSAEVSHPTTKVAEDKPDFSSLSKHAREAVKPFTLGQLKIFYNNMALERNQEFVNEFLESHQGVERHELYELLMNYLRARNNLIGIEKELGNVQEEYQQHQKVVWTFETHVVSEDGECQDGNPVTATRQYQVAKYNESAAALLNRSAKSVKELVTDSFSLNLYLSELRRLQIENFLFRVQSACLAHDALATERLKTCITILFSFQRRSVCDAQFVQDSRDWLKQLVGLLLQVSTPQDHLFLLNHVIRCPAGVGTWATTFIQVPPPQVVEVEEGVVTLGSPELDHLLAVLGSLLRPIRERESFLHHLQSAFSSGGTSPRDNIWVLIDSEGEEDQDASQMWSQLRENDLVSLFNQIPLEALFRHLLAVRVRDDRYEYVASLDTPQYMLKLLALATQLTFLLEEGMQTYSFIRYRQFTKNLSRILGHTVQYVSEHWQIQSARVCEKIDAAMRRRLQAEYDSFFFRAMQCMFLSRKAGAWQFLATVPYGQVSTPVLWRVFCLLHQDCEEDGRLKTVVFQDAGECARQVTDSTFRLDFESRLLKSSKAECFSLLLTFSNMARARGEGDWDFIRTVMLALFQVGFLNPATQDMCSKDTRDLLSGVLMKHPKLFSVLLRALKEYIVDVHKMSLYLFRGLPMELWIPSDRDLKTITTWLVEHEPASVENQLARLIFSEMRWDVEEAHYSCDASSGHLSSSRVASIPLDIHRRVAVATVQACMKHAPDRQQGGLINEGVKQVSNLAAAVYPQSAEQAFCIWAWDVLSRLKLHVFSHGPAHLVFSDPQQAFAHIPNPDNDASMEVLRRGTTAQQPIACFASLLLTTWGHVVPLVCSKGCRMMEVLLLHRKYEAVIEALYYVVPLFLNCADSLVKLDRFHSVLYAVIAADLTYMKMAKNLIATDFPGSILKKLGGMIIAQLLNFAHYGLADPSGLLSLWLTALTSLNNWTRDRSILYLIDLLVRAAFQDAACTRVATEVLRLRYKNSIPSRQGSGVFSSLVSWVGGGGAPGLPTSLLPRASNPECPWFAYFALEVEGELEEMTGLWQRLLEELSSADKMSVDQAAKKAASSLNLPPVPASSLSIYRWSQQALDTPLDHPLLPLFWQKFFFLYLARVPARADCFQRGGVGERFFLGMVNYSFLKKLKRRLQEAADYYQSKANEQNASLEGFDDAENARVTDQDRHSYQEMSSLYTTLNLWLEEPQLHQATVYLPALPPQYASNRLLKLFEGDKSPWMEFFESNKVKQQQQHQAQEWLEQYHKCKFRKTSAHSEDAGSPTEHMFKRLQSYDNPLPHPTIKPIKAPVPLVDKQIVYDKRATLQCLKNAFHDLHEYTEAFSMRVSEHTALDCAYMELLPDLYRQVETEVLIHAACDSRSRSRRSNAHGCAGAVPIVLKFCEARLNEGINHQLQLNRSEYEVLLRNSLQSPPRKVCSASVLVENVITCLIKVHQQIISRAETGLEKVEDVGTSLFYYVTSLVNEESNFYPPMKQLLAMLVEVLGQEFIREKSWQCQRLITSIIQEPHLLGLLAPHFTPAAADTETFLIMYEQVSHIPKKDTDLAFVLLTKFDVNNWVTKFRPQLRERSRLIELIGCALNDAGLVPDEDRLVLHEVYRRHLKTMLLHDFPEHYGEILSLLLKGSDAQTLALDVWYDFLASLAHGSASFKPNMEAVARKKEIRCYATQQKLLAHQEVFETAQYLTNYFVKERLHYGLYGLYPKYRTYFEPVTCYLGMMSHVLVVSTIQKDRGTLADQLASKLWPVIRDLYSPWIAPYTDRQVQESCADWIKQLNDDKKMLLPWIHGDSTLANSLVSMFTDSVQFMQDVLPASYGILSNVWQYYGTIFAHSAVKDYILTVMHSNLIMLSWDKFWPALSDLALMHKVVDLFLPDCHSFLGAIFVQVPWRDWLNNMMPTTQFSVVVKVHVSLLTLMVKLSTEPNLRQSPKMVAILEEALSFPWHLVDATVYEHVINWYVMSCDPNVAALLDERNPLDVATLRLLQVSAGFIAMGTRFHTDTPLKRHLFVKAWARLLSSSATKHRGLVSSRKEAFVDSILRILEDAEAVVRATVPQPQQFQEALRIMGEVLGLCAGPSGSHLPAVAQEALGMWIQQQNSQGVGLLACLHLIPRSLAHVPLPASRLLEMAIQTFFCRVDPFPGGSKPDWDYLVELLPVPEVGKLGPLLEACAKEGLYLTWVAFLRKKQPMCRGLPDEQVLLNSTLELLKLIKPGPTSEAKLPLLWSQLFLLVQRLLEGGCALGKQLQQLSSVLAGLGEERGGWGILGAVGLGKASPLPMRAQLLSRSLAVYLQAQIPPGSPVRMLPGAVGAVVASKATLSSEERPVKPNSKAVQGLEKLESLLNNRQYVEVRDTVEVAIKWIRDDGNSLHNVHVLLGSLVAQLYTEPYLEVLHKFLA